MEAILTEIIHPAIQSTEPDVREAGIQCLGLYCVLDKVKLNQVYNNGTAY